MSTDPAPTLTKPDDDDDTERLPRGLAVACIDDDLERARALIADGVDANTCINDMPALTYACGYAGERLVSLLLDAGADVNLKPTTALSPIAAAAVRGHLPIVRMLLAHGATISNGPGYGALEFATAFRHDDVTLALMAAGADRYVRRGPFDFMANTPSWRLEPATLDACVSDL